MKQLSITMVLVFLPWYIVGQITLSEIMFDPGTDESADEYIEIYNLADSAVSVYQWQVFVDGSPEMLTSPPWRSPVFDSGYLVLEPRTFGLILDLDYWDGTRPYDSVIPDSVKLFTIDDTRFGDYGLSNSSSRTITLKDSSDQMISEYNYSPDNDEGFSDEKVMLSGPNTVSNWKNSEQENGTPGTYNSVSPVDYDLGISGPPVWSPVPAIPDSIVRITVLAVNAGLQPSETAVLYLQYGEQVDSSTIPIILPDDSAVIAFEVTLESGNHQVRAEIYYPDDQDTTNNSLQWTLPVRYPRNTLIINEIMYDPFSGDPEWVEVLNLTGNTIDIGNWSFGDESNEFAVIEESLRIAPDTYWVVAESPDLGNYDYSNHRVSIPADFPNLNNGSDGLWIRDMAGAVIDTVRYSGDWGGGDGVSLERKNPYLPPQDAHNWEGAQSGIEASPTAENSVLSDSVNILLTDISLEPTLPEIGTRLQICGTLRNSGLVRLSLDEIHVYDDTNYDSSLTGDELIVSGNIHSAIGIGDSLEFHVNPLMGEPGFRRIVLVVLLENGSEFALLDTSMRVFYPEQTLLISEIMYTPEEEPEWIELYNKSDNDVQLYDWKIRDATATSHTITGLKSIGPGEYIVVTGDKTLAGFYSQLNTDHVIELPDFPVLNNSGDSLLVISPASIIHDSLRYSSDWGGKNGNSLERKNLQAPATESENWGTSIAGEAATPAAVNSIAVPDYDLSLTNFSAENIGGDLLLSATVQNTGTKSISDFAVHFFHDVNEDSVASSTELISSESGGELAANDSTRISVSVERLSGGYQQFSGVVESSDDVNTGNDSSIISIFLGYPAGTVVINEIMYRPESGEPEWVELFVKKDSVDIRGFSLRDEGHASQLNIHEKRLYNSGDFVILGPDSSMVQNYPGTELNLEITNPFPTLNNGVDSVIISDGTGTVMESMQYTSDWGGDLGVSLERINVNASVNVASNWGTSAADNGSTPGSTNSIAVLENDLRIIPESIFATPEFPEANTPWQLSVEMVNAGTEEISEISIRTFQDTSATSIPWISRDIERSISYGDSAILTIDLPGLPSGRHWMALRIGSPGEQRPSDNAAQFEVTVPFAHQTLLITEFAPIPGEGWSEFIEIYNPSDSTIALTGWRIGDNTALTLAFIGDLTVGDHSYAVIAEDSSVYYEFGLQDAVIYMIPSGWRSLNNTEDMIRLVDPSGRTIDSLQYSDQWEIPVGKSVERKWYLSDGSLPFATSDYANWGRSAADNGATPGRINSIAIRKANSIQLTRMDTIQSVNPGEPISAKFQVKNSGLDTLSELILSVGFDGNMDSILTDREIQVTESIPGIPPADTAAISIDIAAPMYSGNRKLITEAVFGNKTKSSFSNIWIPFNRQSIIFNEFLADPSEVIPQEFIEIVNISDDSIPLGQWILSVNDRSVIIDSSAYLLPGKYGVLSEKKLSLESGRSLTNDSWSSLPNDGGTIRLLDQYGYLMDSLTYTGDWELTIGRSQERLHLEKGKHSTSNWKASVSQNGATPGAENSMYFNTDSANTGWKIGPSAFSPDGDGFDDLLRISYSGDAALQYATIRIFDTVGRTIKTVVRDKPAPVRQSWFWDGKDYRDRVAPIGMYIVHIEYKSMSGKRREKIKTIVLAKPL